MWANGHTQSEHGVRAALVLLRFMPGVVFKRCLESIIYRADAFVAYVNSSHFGITRTNPMPVNLVSRSE
jgi:hypothetical protein